jgi:hypothetical protein
MMRPSINEESDCLGEKNLRRRNLEADTKRMGYTWGQLVRVAQDETHGKLLSTAYALDLGGGLDDDD